MSLRPDTDSSSSSLSKTKAPKFLHLLYTILQHEDQRIISWSHDGSYFQVLDIARLEREVLPKYFKHSKLTSFQRQLNNFGFRKWTKTRANVCTFSHDALVQCHPSRLSELTQMYMAPKAPSLDATAPRTRTSLTAPKRQRSDAPATPREPQRESKRVKTEALACTKSDCFAIDIDVNASIDESLASGAWTFDSIEFSDLCALDWTHAVDDAVADLILEPLPVELECESLDWELAAECFAAIDKDFAVSASFLDVSS